MIDAPIKRSFPYNGYLRLADGTRQPVRIIEQGPDYLLGHSLEAHAIAGRSNFAAKRNRVCTSIAHQGGRLKAELIAGLSAVALPSSL